MLSTFRQSTAVADPRIVVFENGIYLTTIDDAGGYESDFVTMEYGKIYTINIYANSGNHCDFQIGRSSIINEETEAIIANPPGIEVSLPYETNIKAGEEREIRISTYKHSSVVNTKINIYGPDGGLVDTINSSNTFDSGVFTAEANKKYKVVIEGPKGSKDTKIYYKLERVDQSQLITVGLNVGVRIPGKIMFINPNGTCTYEISVSNITGGALSVKLNDSKEPLLNPDITNIDKAKTYNLTSLNGSTGTCTITITQGGSASQTSLVGALSDYQSEYWHASRIMDNTDPTKILGYGIVLDTGDTHGKPHAQHLKTAAEKISNTTDFMIKITDNGNTSGFDRVEYKTFYSNGETLLGNYHTRRFPIINGEK